MKLLDQVRQQCRVRHYSLRTEEAYAYWIERFIRFHGIRHPNTMGAPEVEAFLTDLAVAGRVSASTQNQAFSALLFLYQHVLKIDIGRIDVQPRSRGFRPVVHGRCWNTFLAFEPRLRGFSRFGLSSRGG